MSRSDEAGTGRIVFLAWTSRPGRALDICSALGAQPVLLFPAVGARLPHPFGTAVRYAASAAQTVAALLRHRPRVVIATNPPLFPALFAAAWCALVGGGFVMDSHPSAFGAKGRRVLAKLQPLHRWLGRRARAVLVTTEERAAQVRAWGAHGIVVHEAPSQFPPRKEPEHPTVLFTGVYAADEPVAEVLGAARLLPGVEFRLTGDPAKAEPGLLADLPPNVTCVGYLDQPAYRQEVAGVTVVLTLTSEPTSIMRSAYEAVYARVPVITTDTPDLRETFPYAVHCENSPPSIVAAVQLAIDDLDRLRLDTDAAYRLQLQRWQDQLHALRQACGT